MISVTRMISCTQGHVHPVLLAPEQEGGEVLGGLGGLALLADGGGEEGQVVGARGGAGAFDPCGRGGASTGAGRLL